MYNRSILTGGGFTETLLWTNSSPTSSFDYQNVTLSNNISNYSYLKFEYRASTTDSTSSSVIISVKDFEAFGYHSTSSRTIRSLMMSSMIPNPGYSRPIYYVDDTTIYISSAYAVGATGWIHTSSIPTNIYGLK